MQLGLDLIVPRTPRREGINDPWSGEIKVLMVAEEPTVARPLVNRPNLARDFWNANVRRAAWFDPEKEACVVIIMDRKNRSKAWNLVSLGTATGSIVHPREILRPVIVASGTAFLIMHNHPTGDPTPSRADLEVTRRLREGALACDIEFQDHVIIDDSLIDPSGRGYYSFREAGLI